ncbi:MAG TPA: hypothetical protein VF058_05340 [Actinomycetota bacterium]
MALALILVAAGSLLLYGGAELTDRGLSRVSIPGVPALGPRAIRVGAEIGVLAAALAAAGRGETEIAGGLATGGALFLLAVGMGWRLAVGQRPLVAPSSTLLLLAPSGAVILAALAVSGRYVDRLEGLLLAVGFAGYLVLRLREHADLSGGEEPPREGAPAREPDPESDGARSAAPAVVGMAILTGGAVVIVEGGVRLSLAGNLAAGFVGASLLAALTTLHRAIPRSLGGEPPEHAAGSLLGSITALLAGVLGLAALVRPLTIDTGVNLAFLGVAVLSAVVAVALLLRRRAGWILGVALLASYATWLVYASGA